jgi:putative SOS response-associated peptidase YedK
MPLILEKGRFDDWMRAPTREAEKMTQPYGGDVKILEVSPDVGNVNAGVKMHRLAGVKVRHG